MKCNLLCGQALLLVFLFFGVCWMYADEQRELLEEKKPPLVRRGGLSSEDRWKEGDVKEYLALPYVTRRRDVGGISIDDITNAIKSAQLLGQHQIHKNQEGSPELIERPGAISFKLRENDKVVFHVTVHESESWNRVCDELYKYVTTTVDLWNKIPEYYKVTKDENRYVVSRGGNNPQKWHFDLKKRLVVIVYSEVRQEDAENKENTAAQIELIIGDLDALIDNQNSRDN